MKKIIPYGIFMDDGIVVERIENDPVLDRLLYYRNLMQDAYGVESDAARGMEKEINKYLQTKQSQRQEIRNTEAAQNKLPKKQEGYGIYQD